MTHLLCVTPITLEFIYPEFDSGYQLIQK